MKVLLLLTLLFYISSSAAASIPVEKRDQAGPQTELTDEEKEEKERKESGVKFQPQLTVDDNTLKPSLTFFTRSRSIFTRTYKGENVPFLDNYFLFQFTANSGINVGDFENPTESTEEIISKYVADGGNIEFDLSYRLAYNDWDFSVGGFYSLLSTDAVSTEQGTSDIISVDAEVYGISAFVSYSFNEVILYSEYRIFETSDEGQNVDFTAILDDGNATEFGVSLPLSTLSLDGASTNNERDGFYLTLSRTKHSGVDKAIFRVTVQKRFDFE